MEINAEKNLKIHANLRIHTHIHMYVHLTWPNQLNIVAASFSKSTPLKFTSFASDAFLTFLHIHTYICTHIHVCLSVFRFHCLQPAVCLSANLEEHSKRGSSSVSVLGLSGTHGDCDCVCEHWQWLVLTFVVPIPCLANPLWWRNLLAIGPWKMRNNQVML